MGHGADTVVAANVCLDIQCMRVASFAYLQKKSDVVNKFTLKDIINASWDEYCADNADNNDFEDGSSPQR